MEVGSICAVECKEATGMMALTMDSGGVDTVPTVLPKKGHYHLSGALSPPTSTRGDLIGHFMYQFPTLRIKKIKSSQQVFFIS